MEGTGKGSRKVFEITEGFVKQGFEPDAANIWKSGKEKRIRNMPISATINEL